MDKNDKHAITETENLTAFNYEVDGKPVHLGDVLCDQYGTGKVIGFGEGNDGYAIVFLDRNNGIFPRHVCAMSWPDSWEKLRDDAIVNIRYGGYFRGFTASGKDVVLDIDDEKAYRIIDSFIKRAKALGKEGK